MLTRLEVKGFKNLIDMRAEFGAFTCIAGANGIGKSNVLDAIEFLAYLASEPFHEASQKVRGATGERGGDARDLFWNGYQSDDRRIDMAVEMIVPRAVEDDLGAATEAATTFLRYELSLGYEAPSTQASMGRLTLLGENLTHITRGDAYRHLRFRHSVKDFRNSVVLGQRRGGAFISTANRDGATIINVHGDGGSRGRPQPRAAARAGRTVLSTVTTNDYPTILAARREMQSWRRLALEPTALRAPDSFSDARVLGVNGQHLASTLYRIANESGVDPESVYARIVNRLSDLTDLGVERLTVEPDPVREVFTLFLQEPGGLRLPARALSEGTLRFLALCVLLEDPQFTGLMCMEEPENGIHPANLPAMVGLIQDLAVDPEITPDTTNPFRQVIVNTHSPGVVQLCDPEDLLLAETRVVRTTAGTTVRALTLLPFRKSWRAIQGEPTFAHVDVTSYLVPPAEALLTLPHEIAG